MTRPPSRILAPRRIAVALLIVLAGGALSAIAVAADDPETRDALPASFGVPTLLPGDAGRYDLSVAGAAPEPFFSFEVRGPVVQYDRLGQPHEALELVINETGRFTAGGGERGACDGDCERNFRLAHYFLAADGRVVARTDEQLWDPTRSDGSQSHWQMTQTTIADGSDPIDDASNLSTDILCGMVSRLQGTQLPTDQDLQPFGRPCSALAFWTSGDRHAFRAAAFDVVGEVATLRYDDTRAEGLSLHFNAGIPVAVQVRVEERTATLAGFTRGQTATALALPASVDAVGAWQEAPRAVWGPDESGTTVRFPLSSAFAAARDDVQYTGLRDYLAAHPDARVYQADFQEMTYGSEADRVDSLTWTFSLYDQGQRLHLCVNLRTESPDAVPQGLPYGLYGGSGTTIGEGSECADGRLGTGYPESRLLPATMPKVQPLLDVWPAYAGAAPGVTADTWGFDYYCDDDACSTVGLQLRVGRAVSHLEQPPLSFLDGIVPDAPADEEALEWVSLHVAPDGPYRLFAWRIREGPTATTYASPAGASLDPASTHASGISPGTIAVAASTSVVALVAAALYLLWPALKGGALGLFSRIQAPQALDHPVRAQVATLVGAEPGIHAREVMRRLGLARGTVAHHLEVLVRTGVLVARQGPHYTCFFPAGAGGGTALAAATATKAPGASALLAAVRASPGLRLADAARAAGITRQAASQHARALEAAGLLRLQAAGAVLRLHPLGAPGGGGHAVAGAAA